jgi:hypothetical protein
MKTEEVIIDGQKHVIVTKLEEGFDDDRIVTEDIEDTVKIPVEEIVNSDSNESI